MGKKISLEDWIMTRKISSDKRMASARINLRAYDPEMLAKIGLQKREKARDEFLKASFQKLIATEYFDGYQLIGTKRRPYGVIVNLSLATITKLAKQPFIKNIFIERLAGARKKKDKKIREFFCIKMTVSIQVEGFTTGKQLCEDRYVLVQAATIESAYKMVKKQEKSYEEPYLNSDVRLVRWKIESYDDCYSTGITSINDFNDPKGVEVFSKFRNRKLTSERAWK